MIRERSPQAFHLYMESNELFQEANDEAKRARKNAQEFMRQQYGSVNPKSLTSKQRNRMKTFLKDQDYNPEDSTVKTDIIDKSTGKPVRVKLDIDGTNPILKGQPQPFAMEKNKLDEENEDIGTTLRDYMTNYLDTDDKTIAHYDDNNDHIAMPKSIMKRHPSISTGTFKHEEGHINKTYNPEEITKYEGKAQEKIDDAASKGINTNIHDKIPEEYAVDTYSALHNKYSDKTRFLRALASNDISQMKAMKKQCKKQLDDIMSNIDWNGDITELKESFNMMLSTSKDMLNMYQDFIKDTDPSDENYSSMIKVIDNFKNNILTYQGIIEKLNNGDIQGSKEDMINNNLPNIKTQLQAAYKELDNGMKMREEFVKEMIKECAIQYQIPVSKVIQEMYQDMFHLYIFQEGILNDIKNKVNPKSNKLFFHITRDGSTYTNDFFKTFEPRVPNWLSGNDEYAEQDGLRENSTTPRVCVSPSIEGALNSLRSYINHSENERIVRSAFVGKKYYVYSPLLPIENYNIKTNAQIVKDDDVWDAKYTGETWILDKVTLRLYGVIVIDEVLDLNNEYTKEDVKEELEEKEKNHDKNKKYMKLKEDHTGKMSFKWHWEMTPKQVVQDPRLKSIIDRCIQKQIADKTYDPQLWPNVERTKQLDDRKKRDALNKKINEAHSNLTKLNREYIEYFNNDDKKDVTKLKSMQDELYKAKKEYMELEEYDKDEIESELNMLKEAFKRNLSSITTESYQFNRTSKFQRMFQESDDLLEPAPVDELTPSETVDTNTSDDGPAPVEAPEEITNDTLSDDTNESIDDINSEIDSSMESEDPADDALTPPPEENDDDFDLPIPGYMERNLNQTPPPDVSVTSVCDPMTDDYNISNMGMNDSNQQNQYNPEELKILNTLITGEQKMIGTYFDAVKNTNVDVLRRLYGDIGADKAVHQEELMFAKAELTGEPYEPANPDIRNEYQNLLNMGMDESTAMYTAVDKHSVWGGNAALDTMDDSSFAQLEYDLSMLHQIGLQNQIIFQLGNECIKNTKDRDHALSVFTESYIMEAMANTTEISDKYTKLPGPLKLIGMAIDGIIKMIKAIREKSVEIIKRLRLKFDKTARFIKNNGISGLFADGVKLYFYSDETNRIDLSEPARYIDLLSFMMQNIAKSMQMQINFDFTLQTENVKNPIRPNNLDDCIAKLKGIIIDKTKVVVDKNNEKLLEREIFGYSDGKLNNGLALQDVDKAIRTSDNAFNRIDILAKTVEQHMTVAKKMFDEMVKLSGQNGSIYHTNRAVYNKCMEAMKFMISKYQMFCNYLTHDLDQLMKLNNGLFEAVKKADTTEAFTGKKPNIIDDAKTTGSMINPQKEQLQQKPDNPKKKKRLFGK